MCDRDPAALRNSGISSSCNEVRSGRSIPPFIWRTLKASPLAVGVQYLPACQPQTSTVAVFKHTLRYRHRQREQERERERDLALKKGKSSFFVPLWPVESQNSLDFTQAGIESQPADWRHLPPVWPLSGHQTYTHQEPDVITAHCGLRAEMKWDEEYENNHTHTHFLLARLIRENILRC